MDELLARYAQELYNIYTEREGAGEDTFLGLLARFERDRRILMSVPHEPECKEYGHQLAVQARLTDCRADISATKFKNHSRSNHNA